MANPKKLRRIKGNLKKSDKGKKLGKPEMYNMRPPALSFPPSLQTNITKRLSSYFPVLPKPVCTSSAMNSTYKNNINSCYNNSNNKNMQYDVLCIGIQMIHSFFSKLVLNTLRFMSTSLANLPLSTSAAKPGV